MWGPRRPSAQDLLRVAGCARRAQLSACTCSARESPRTAEQKPSDRFSSSTGSPLRPQPPSLDPTEDSVHPSSLHQVHICLSPTSASPAPPTRAPSSRTGAPCAPKCEGAQTSGRALSLTSGGAAAGAATSARRRRSVGESWNKKKGKEARGARARLRSKTDCASDFLRGAPRDPTAA